MNKPSRILVCGGRGANYRFVHKILDKCVHHFADDFLLIHGGARGADMHAHMWAFYQGCAVMRMDANWDFYPKKAGFIRNSWMLKWAQPELVIAIDGGNGTADTVKKARDLGITVYEVRNNES